MTQPTPQPGQYPPPPVNSAQAGEARPSIGALFASVTGQISGIIRGEIELNKAKLRTFAAKSGKGIALLVVAAVFALYLLGWTLHTAEIALTLVLPAWAASLIIVGVLLLLRRRQAFVGLGLEHLIDGRFTQSQEVSAWASRLRADNEGPRSRALMVAVGLFMLSPVPTVVAAVLGSRYDHSIYLAVGVCLTLAFVATGLLVLLPVSWASSTYETLTEEGQPTTTAGRSNALVGAVAAVYWPLVTAVFLVWGFLGYWDICWIIWPVAGVLFGAVAALVSLVSGGSGGYYRRQRRDWR